jgi:hypothetical protein
MHWLVSLFNVNTTNSLHCRDAVVVGISFDGLETRAVDHFDDLLFGHFHFASGFDRVAVGEFAAVGDGAVEVVGAEVVVIKSPS